MCCRLLHALLCRALFALRLGILSLRRKDKLLLAIHTLGTLLTAQLLTLLQAHLYSLKRRLTLAFCIMKAVICREILLARLKHLDTLIYRRNLRLATLEEVLRAQHVVDSRNEVFMVIATCEITREGCQEAQLGLGLDNQYAKHLTLRQLLMPLPTRVEVCLHLLGRDPAERVWRIVEWIGKESWQLDVLDVRCKAM